MPTPSITREQAARAAERLRGLFPIESHARWEVAGALRRGADAIPELYHVVQPILDTSPLDDPDARAMGLNGPANPLWRRLDNLLAGGVVSKLYTGAESGFLWHEHFRGISYQGFPHYLLIAGARTWGTALVAATGPREFVKTLWARLEAKGYRVRPGLQVAGVGSERVEVRTEEELFALAGAVPVAPPDRGPGTRLRDASVVPPARPRKRMTLRE